jgi:hypothetical protein
MVLIGRRLTATDLGRLNADPSLARDLLNDEDGLYLDKSWHGIHFLLAGKDWETTEGAGEAILGGDPIGEDDGYGPARLVTADRVHTVAAALRTVDEDTLRGRYDAEGLTAAEIYPEIWDEADVLDEYLLPYFQDLRSFYLAAADAGEAVLLAIT